MKVYESGKIRNIVILGHSGSGKTTLSESALFASGVTSRMGRVEDGNTVSDYDADEIRRRVSISASIIPVEWQDSKINIIDTPGYFDFVGEVQQALRAADASLIVVSGKSGIEVGAEKAWDYAKAQNLPTMILINSMDDENADFDAVVESLKEKFGPSIAPLQVPIKEGNKFIGFVDIIKNEGIKYTGGKAEPCPVPGDLSGKVEEIRNVLEEAVAGSDEELMEKFIMEEPLTAEEIIKGLKAGLKDRSVTPVLCGAATQGIGIAELLGAIVSFAPSAVESNEETKGKNPKNDEDIVFKGDESAPFSALVFKTISDNFGRLNIFRVYSGSINRNTQLYNASTENAEKIGQLLVLRGKEQISVDELRAGDIGALVKLANTSTNDTLCVKENPIILPGVSYSTPLYQQNITPKAKGDEDKLGQALSRIQDEDKTINFRIDPETKQSVISGIGDNHLDVVVHKMRNRFKLEVDLSPVIVPYRETIKGKVEQQGRHKKQSGGRGQFGDVHIRFEPSGDMTKDYVFAEEVFGGSVPRNFFPAVEKGIAECVKSGPIAGYPVVGLKATLFFGSYHDVDSDELSFRLATSIAFKEGFMKAKPVLLEPIASVEVTVPDSYTGDIMGDMNKRRGRVLGMSMKNGKQVISAEAPMSEMFKYTLDLRSMTQGRGEFALEFNRYEEAPNDVAQKVIEARKKETENK
ncbi:MAG: elongation factor G [Defluviitaleaceae bacterium]|nr:elongation factor G [Defluviitaleaceae bacterium]MCL2837166.1 elongation factor G [Defluviitaleaceae bacterium]